MAHTLEMDVITEGVETQEQLQSLATIGCSHFQGYYFYKPLPVSDFENIRPY